MIMKSGFYQAPTLAFAIGLALWTAAPAAAQGASCPILTDAAASSALQADVRGQPTPTNVPGLDACNFEDPDGNVYSISRQTGALAPTSSGPVALAQIFIPNLPDSARAQLAALTQLGLKVTIGDNELSSLSGVGDAALWVKSDTAGDGLYVQRGSDAFAFESDDAPGIQSRLTALAQAALTSQ